MVRLADLPEGERANHFNRVATLPRFASRPWVRGKPLAERRVAPVTTAGPHLRSDRPFDSGGAGMGYRVIPGDVAPDDLVMSAPVGQLRPRRFLNPVPRAVQARLAAQSGA